MQAHPGGDDGLHAEPPIGASSGEMQALSPKPPSVPRIDLSPNGRPSLSPTASLTFPLRPAQSPKIVSARASRAASRKHGAPGGGSRGSAIRCWWSSSTRSFVLPPSSERGGPQAAKQLREYFQKLPVFSGVPPMGRNARAGAALPRALAVPYLVQEPLSPSAQDPHAGQRSRQENALIRRLRAEVKHMRTIVALHHHASLVAGGGAGSRSTLDPEVGPGEPGRAAEAMVSQLRGELATERSRRAREVEAERQKAASELAEERARAASAAQAAAEERAALRKELDELKRTLQDAGVPKGGADEGQPLPTAEAETAMSQAEDTPPGPSAQAAAPDVPEDKGDVLLELLEGAADAGSSEQEVGQSEPGDGQVEHEEAALGRRLVAELIAVLERERLSAEAAFDAITGGFGDMSVSELAAATSRAQVCKTRAEVEALFRAVGGRTPGGVDKEAWCGALSGGLAIARKQSAGDLELSIDLSAGIPDEDFQGNRPRGERLARALRVVSVGLKLKCGDSAILEKFSSSKGKGTGALLASGGEEDTIVRLWTPDGQEVGTLNGHSDTVYCVAWNHDGSLLASGGKDGIVRLWKPDSQKMGTLMRGHSASVRCVAWNHNGSLLASASNDNTVRVWNPDGPMKANLEGHRVCSKGHELESFLTPRAGFSCSLCGDQFPEGTNLWGCRACDWDACNRQDCLQSEACLKCTLKGHSGGVCCVAWNHDGSLLASGGDDGIRLWTPDGLEKGTLRRRSGSVRCVAWNHDGSLLASSSDESAVQLWDPTTVLEGNLKGHRVCPQGHQLVMFSTWATFLCSLCGGRFPSGTNMWGCRACDWDACNTQDCLQSEAGLKCTLRGHSRAVNCVAWNHDGSLLASASNDNTVRLWNPDGQMQATLTGHSEVFCVAWNQDGSLLACGGTEGIRLWTPDGTEKAGLAGHSGTVFSVAWKHFRSRSFNHVEEDLDQGDLELLVQANSLDVSPDDIKSLAMHLAAGEERISAKRWNEALDAEEEQVERMWRVLTIVASGILWDIRTVYDAFPAKNHAEIRTLVPLSVTRDDLMDMNDSWQFCLSHEEVDCWHSYMDASHCGRVTMRSWASALEPFCAAITAVGSCLQRLCEKKNCETPSKLFDEFDADSDGKLTPKELLTSCRKEMPELGYPEEHIRVFHKHLTYFTETDDPSVFPSHWIAAFDLVECEVVPARVAEFKSPTHCPKGHLLEQVGSSNKRCDMCSSDIIDGTDILHCEQCDWDACNTKECLREHASDKSDVEVVLTDEYSLIVARAQRAMASEQLAVLLLRASEGASGTGPQTPGVVDILASLDQDSPLPLTDNSIEALHWRLLLEYWEVAPPLGCCSEDDTCEEALNAELKSAVASLQRRLATRGSQLLVVLLASHKLSIEAAYEAFCEEDDHGVTLARFKHILHLLAPDFGAVSPRAECLFLALTNAGVGEKTVCKENWVKELQKAAGHLSNKQFVSCLLSTAADSDPDQGARQATVSTMSNMTYGERQRLCDVFFSQDPQHSVGGAMQAKAGLNSSLFIDERKLGLALAKMGVFSTRNHLTIAESEPKIDTLSMSKQFSTKKRRRFRRGGVLGADKNEPERARVEGTTTLWDFEREVERSRVTSTFEQIKLPKIFADALCDEMQPEKGICTPLAMEHLQSRHLMSWMLALGKERLRELLGRMYEMKKSSIIDALSASILHFQTRHEAQTNMSMNSKYSTWSSTFGGTLRTARFGKLEDFKKGLDATLGMPSFNIESQIQREHCNMHNSHTFFAPPNNPDIKTCSADEWNYVVNYDPTREYPAGDDRSGGTVNHYLSLEQAKKAGLTRAEVIALRLYSGPMYGFYNQVLRGQEEKQYVTTIHAIVSAIIKLAAIMKLPSNRKVYRGLSGIELPVEFWQEDEYGAKGGVEFGIMSTTRKAQVAVQYSTYGEVPTVFEIEIGQVDRGAELNWISQFPGEEEVVMPPLSNLEVTGDPYLKRLDGREAQILIVPLRVNVNIKSKTMEELEATRKGVLLSGIMDMKTVSEQEVGELAQSLGTIQAIADGQETEWFNDQVAHLERIQEKNAVSNEGAVAKCTRLDLQETVAFRLDGAGAEATQARENKEVRHATANIVSLQKRMWAQRLSKAPTQVDIAGSEVKLEEELGEFTTKHAVSLEVASSLVSELDKAKLSLKDCKDGFDDAEFCFRSLLDLHKDIVRALLVNMKSSQPLKWHRGENHLVDHLSIELRDEGSMAVFPRANQVRTIMSSRRFEQHSFQVGVEAAGGSIVAVGVLPEQHFQQWQSGEWSFPSQEALEIAYMEGAETPVAEECQIVRVSTTGGVFVLCRTSGTFSSATQSTKALGMVVTRLKQKGKDAESSFELLDDAKIGKISRKDLEFANVEEIVQGVEINAIFAQIADEDGFISRDAWVSAFDASMLESNVTGTAPSSSPVYNDPQFTFNHDQKNLGMLQRGSSIGIVLDSRRNRLSFSIDTKHIGTVPLSKFEIGSKYVAAAAVLEGSGGCKVHIESAPVLSFHRAHLDCATREDVEREIAAILKNSDLESQGRQMLLDLLDDGSKVILKDVKSSGDKTKPKDDVEKAHVPEAAESGPGKDAGDDSEAKSLVPGQKTTDDAETKRPAFGKDVSDPAQAKSLGGIFYNELTEMIGEDRACTEFMSMLVSWRNAGYNDLDNSKEVARERARVIAACKLSLKTVCDNYLDGSTKRQRELEYRQEKAGFAIQTQILHFMKEDSVIRCRRLMSLVIPCRCPRELCDQLPTSSTLWFEKLAASAVDNRCHHVANDRDIFQISRRKRLGEAFQEFVRCLTTRLDCVSVSLLNVVVEMLGGADGSWEEALKLFGPALEVLEKIDDIITNLSATLNTLQESENSFRQLSLDIEAAESLSDSDLEKQHTILHNWYRVGGIAAKQEVAKMRAEAAQETFARLRMQKESHTKATAAISKRDLLWMCHDSVCPELWLLSIFNVEHADRVAAWFDRHCVGSELMRMVSRLDDNTLQQTHCQRRFDSVVETISAACNVLPLVSTGAVLPTERRYAALRKDVEHVLNSSQNESLVKQVRANVESGTSRIQNRWNIKSIESVDEAMSAESRWELRRAEAQYWQAMIALNVQALDEMEVKSTRRTREGALVLRRRSVARCLELLDDTVYGFGHDRGGSKGEFAEELNLDDAMDEWEARVLGMLSLRQSVCKLNTSSLVSNMSIGLPLADIASGTTTELSLCTPDLKVAAFISSFVARSSPTTVSVFVREKDGKASGMKTPIVLVSGGGLSAHISTNEVNARMLDFGSKGLTVYGLRLLVEAARADQDVLEATIAGVNDFDLSGDELAISELKFAQDHFKRKSVVEDMRFENNVFGKDTSIESMSLICNIIFVSASNLRFLNLSSNNITCAGGKVLARFFAKAGASSLKHLDISYNDLQDEGAEQIAKILEYDQQEIEHLNFAGNHIQWRGALHLAEAISLKTCHLTDLKLADNTVESQGMVALAAALALNETVRSIDVSKNNIGDVGVEALAHSWPSKDRGSMHSLTALDISENDVTFLGASKLFGVDLDKFATELTSLSLSSNRICDSGIGKIAQLIPSRTKLHTLCLETQRPLHEMSKPNEMQLLVRSELWAGDTSISENDAKLRLLSDIKCCGESSDVSRMVVKFCTSSHREESNVQEIQSVNVREQDLEKRKQDLENRKQDVKREWATKRSKRSDAMAMLKGEWSRAGKPLSHLNRRDLLLRTNSVLTPLIKCSDDMRSKEAVFYLSDHNYTKALTTSLEAKRACIDSFRGELFACLMRPLQAHAKSEESDGNVAAADVTVAKDILEQEINCLSVQKVVEYQRLLTESKKFQQGIEQAQRSCASFSVTKSFLANLLEDSNAFKNGWSTKIRGVQFQEVVLMLLAGVVQETMREVLKALEGNANKMLKEDVRQRLKAMPKKEEAADAGPLAHAVELLNSFIAKGSEKLLTLTVEHGEQMVLLEDFCSSEGLSYTVQDSSKMKPIDSTSGKDQAMEVGSRVRLTKDFVTWMDAASGPMVPGQVGIVSEHREGGKQPFRIDGWWYCTEALELAPSHAELVVEKKAQDTDSSLRTRQAVTEVFENHPPFKTAWTMNANLNSLWNVGNGEGEIARIYPNGSDAYWQEVGWLVHHVWNCGFYTEVEYIVKEQAAAEQSRWSINTDQIANETVEKQLELVKDQVSNYYTEHKLKIQEAYTLCSSLKDIWNKSISDPRGFVKGALFPKGAGADVNNLRRFLEVQRMMSKIVEAMSVDNLFGLRWRKAGTSAPENGSEIKNPALSGALQTGQLTFSSSELDQFFLGSNSELDAKSYIKIDEEYFQPIDDRKEQLEDLRTETYDTLLRLHCNKTSSKAEALLAQPLRQAKQRIEVAKHHLRAIFNQQKVDGGTEYFTSPAVLSVLEDAAQHSQNLKALDSLKSTLPFYALRCDFKSALSLPLALAASAPVRGAKVSFVQKWHIDPSDKSRKYSSVEGDDASGRGFARSRLGSSLGWVPKHCAAGEWIEIDMGEVHCIAGIVTQGCATGHDLQQEFAKVISVEHRLEESEGCQWVAAVPASFECTRGDDKVEHEFNEQVNARYVRIIVKEWHSGIVLRAGVLQKKSETWEGSVLQAHEDKCLVQFEGTARWCPAVELVDLRQVEWTASLEVHLSNELAKLKHLYLQGGWRGKGEIAVTQIADRVRKALENKSKEWDDSVKKVAESYSADREAVTLKATERQQPVCQWLWLLVQSGGMEHVTGFWNLNSRHPFGSVCAVETHRWEFLKGFVLEVSKAIEQRIRESQEAVDRQIQWSFGDTTIAMESVCVWSERKGTVEFSENDTVATGGDSEAALGTFLVPGTLTYTLKMEAGMDFFVGVANETYDVRKYYRDDENKHSCIAFYSYNGGLPFYDGKQHESLQGNRNNKPNIQSGDQVRVVYDGGKVEFFVNTENESRFRADCQGRMRPMVYFSEPGSVEMRFDSLEGKTKKTLVLSCTPPKVQQKSQEGDSQPEEHANAEEITVVCNAESPCESCQHDRERLQEVLLRDLASDVGGQIQKWSDKAADAKLSEQAWKAFAKHNIAQQVLPTSEAKGRVVEALNRLPAALLAEPQCCQRMTAAVGLLAAASAALPLDNRLASLPLGTSLLVPPFEALAETPALLRCVELLERGTGLTQQKRKALIWEEVQIFDNNAQDTVTLSENGSLVIGKEDCRASVRGTPFETGSVTFELASFPDGFVVGIALEGHKMIENEAVNEAVLVAWVEDMGWGGIIRGEEGGLDLKRKPDAGKEAIRVDYDGTTAKFFCNDETEPILTQEGLSGPVRPLTLIGKQCRIRILADELTVAPERLSLDRAIEPLALSMLQSMSPWEARVFASVCVSPYAITTSSGGSIALQQLAAGQLETVTLALGDASAQGAAFLAHFVARCCRTQVRVKLESGTNKAASQQVVLSPGGGLEAHVRKDTTQSAASSRDRLLFLTGKSVGVEALRLLMEGALAGLQEAAPVRKAEAADAAESEEGDEAEAGKGGQDAVANPNQSPTKDDRPTTSASPEFSELLGKAAKQLESLTLSKSGPNGQQPAEGREIVRAVEMDDNPMIGAGGAATMRLVVQVAHLTSGASLVRLHLANCGIEDEGARALSTAFIRDRFAPRLATLWLSDNAVTDAGADDLGNALATSLKCLTGLFLFRNQISPDGKATLRKKSSHRTLTLKMHL